MAAFTETLDFLIGSLVLFLCFFSSGKEAKDFCSTETFVAQCDIGHVILMTSGQYGRMRLGRCVKIDFGFIGCTSEVIDILDRHCSGRRDCKLRIPDPEMDDTKPCLNDLTRYLEASYDCIPVVSPDSTNCPAVPSPIVAAQNQPQSGYLLGPALGSSASSGLLGCPWKIAAAEGQRINLTLYDFGRFRREETSETSRRNTPADLETIGDVWDSSAKMHSPASGVDIARLQQQQQQQQPSQTSSVSGAAVCHRYAVVADIMARTDIDICSSTTRISHAYTSVGNSLEIRLLRMHHGQSSSGQHPQQPTAGPFVLRYEVIGCPQIKLASTYWVRTSDMEATVGCFTNPKTWRLECKKLAWTGEIGNCSEETHKIASLATPHAQDAMIDVFTSLPAGLAVLIIIILATFIGLGIAAVGLTFIKRRRRRPCRMAKPVLTSFPPRGESVVVLSGHQANKTFPSDEIKTRTGRFLACPLDYTYCACAQQLQTHDSSLSSCAATAVTTNSGGGCSHILHPDEFLYSISSRPASPTNQTISGYGVSRHVCAHGSNQHLILQHTAQHLQLKCIDGVFQTDEILMQQQEADMTSHDCVETGRDRADDSTILNGSSAGYDGAPAMRWSQCYQIDVPEDCTDSCTSLHQFRQSDLCSQPELLHKCRQPEQSRQPEPFHNSLARTPEDS